jgi:hypothetical protein
LSEDGGFHHALFNARVIDLLPAFLFPTRRRGTRWLREQLRELGVKAPLSPGCLDEFVASAAKEALLARSSGETYAASLRKQLEARARFVHLWTTTDDKMTQPECDRNAVEEIPRSTNGATWGSEWIAIARRHLLPRSWKIQETSVTESHRDLSFAVPERLIVKGPRGTTTVRPIDSATDLPGTEILSDLKQASDKS